MSQGNVKCPVHGEHGNSSNGQCWHCVQSGMLAPKPPCTVTKRPVLSSTSNVTGMKRKIA